MPEQSIASYISNLTALGIMILVSLFLFLILFIISKVLINLNLEGSQEDKETEKNLKEEPSSSLRTINLKKDPNIFVNLLSLFFFFIFFIIFILLSLFFIILKDLMSVRLNIAFIGLIFIFLIFITVYIVKSKIFKRS